jgi:hypothetical protein
MLTIHRNHEKNYRRDRYHIAFRASMNEGMNMNEQAITIPLFFLNIHTYHSRFIPERVAEVDISDKYSSETPTFYQN